MLSPIAGVASQLGRCAACFVAFCALVVCSARLQAKVLGKGSSCVRVAALCRMRHSKPARCTICVIFVAGAWSSVWCVRLAW
jgi:hypothetical protein